MSKIRDEIAHLERMMEQKRQRLRDLKAKETKQEKKDTNRRIFVYGKAFLAMLETLPQREKAESLRRVHDQITSDSERSFLGLPVDRFPAQEEMPPPESGDPFSGDLPFD